MNNWNEAELAFRCERLSARLERLAQNFLRMGILSQDVTQADAILLIVQESKSFLELTAIDLDVDSAFELAQMQRQLSRWHLHWAEMGGMVGFGRWGRWRRLGRGECGNWRVFWFNRRSGHQADSTSPIGLSVAPQIGPTVG
jgi:hypothetical protein